MMQTFILGLFVIEIITMLGLVKFFNSKEYQMVLRSNYHTDDCAFYY